MFGVFENQQLPVDVCPNTYLTRDFARFNSMPEIALNVGETIFPEQEIKRLVSRNYEYTMVLTLYVDRDTCYSTSPSRAVEQCHLVHFDSVFMLYFAGPNRARFHFFADRNYFES